MANRRLRKELLETARGLYELGAVDGKTMREFESLRVESPKTYSAYEIKRLRLKERASQAVFAAYLNTSVSTVQKWEVGANYALGPGIKAVGGFMYYNAYGPSSAVVGNSWAVMLGMDLRF